MKRVKLIFALFIISFILSGCWDSIELENQFLVWGLGWDTTKDNPGNITVTLSAPSTGENAPEPFTNISVAGYSFLDAIKKAQTQISSAIEMGHLRVLIIGEDFAKRGIQKFMDALGRDPRIGRSTRMVVIDGRALDALQVEYPGNPLPADYIVSLLETNINEGTTVDVTFRDFTQALSVAGYEPVTPYLKIAKDKKKINVSGAALFKGDKMVGVIDQNEVQAYQVITGKAADTTFTIGQATEPGEDSLTFIYRRGGTDVKTKVIDEIPHVFLTIKIEGDITEYTSAKPIINVNNIKEAERAVESRLKSEVEKLINKIQREYESDIFGFGQYFQAYHNDYWNKHDWSNEYSRAIIKVNVQVDIRRIGIES